MDDDQVREEVSSSAIEELPADRSDTFCIEKIEVPGSNVGAMVGHWGEIGWGTVSGAIELDPVPVIGSGEE